ncbi:hypothetical protein HHUSO_G11194 [Huso huso]|uniref:CxC7-like cysteine cluster associated with KDZ transposases domain-containing protein n=1 Tax=Huso huso TaxID=61971 RepID=A0ABR0ZLE1_HUSHU
MISRDFVSSVVNWNMFTQEYIQEHRSEFQITECGHCGTSCKDLAAGYVGDGQHGVLRGYYAEVQHPGFCSVDCAQGHSPF